MGSWRFEVFKTEIQKKDLKGVSIIMNDIFKLLQSQLPERILLEKKKEAILRDQKYWESLSKE
uniref:Uncharacterized protein n=1 Tax=Magallana gigas TaxID=29159 RepID=K1R7Z6_MAGGI